MGTESAGTYSEVEELVGAFCCENLVCGIGAEDYASDGELEDGGAMANT